MIEEFKPKLGDEEISLGQEVKIRFNLNVGDTVVSRSGTIRLIEGIDLKNKCFIIKRMKVGKGVIEPEQLSFDTLNSGISNVAYVRHLDGTMEFADDEAELVFLQKEVSKREDAFRRGDAILDLNDAGSQEKHLAELEAKLDR